VVPLGDMLVFTTLLVGTGLYFRHRRRIHKRLMLLLLRGRTLTAPIARIQLDFIQGTVGCPRIFALTDLFCHRLCEPTRLNAVHPWRGWGSLLIVVSQPFHGMFVGHARMATICDLAGKVKV
jgi:hypothetical protein